MRQIAIRDLKAHISAYLTSVVDHQTAIVVTSRGTPIAIILPYNAVVEHHQPPATSHQPHLSEDDILVLRLLAHGLSNEQIAAELCVCGKTVQKRLRHLYSTLQVNNRVEAAVWAARHDLV